MICFLDLTLRGQWRLYHPEELGFICAMRHVYNWKIACVERHSLRIANISFSGRFGQVRRAVVDLTQGRGPGATK